MNYKEDRVDIGTRVGRYHTHIHNEGVETAQQLYTSIHSDTQIYNEGGENAERGLSKEGVNGDNKELERGQSRHKE